MNRKQKIVVSIFIILVMLFTSYGYAALNTKLSISGEAYVRSEADIRVTALRLSSIETGGYETYNSKYTINTVSTFVTLPSNKSAIYEIEVTNNTNEEYYLKNIIANTNYELINSKIYDVFQGKSQKKFYLKIKNIDTKVKEIASNLEFIFEKDKSPTIALNDLPVWMTMGDEYKVTTTYNTGPSGGTTACKSNIDTTINNITDLKVLSKGNHTITCTVTSNTGKTATATKSTKITYDPYNSSNIISNGSFEKVINGLSEVRGTVSRVTNYPYHGSYTLKLTPNANVNEVLVLFPKFNYQKGHKYYYQLYYYIPSNAPATQSAELFCLAENRTTDVGLPHKIFNTKGGAIAALYIDKPDWESNNTMQFRLDNNCPNSTLPIYIDAVIAIDLTQTFGSGNEPDSNWCSKHIKYFDGTAIIYK